MQETNAIGLGFNDSADVAKNKVAPWSKGSTMLTYSFSSGAYQTHEFRVEHFVHEHWSLLYTTSYSVRPSYGINSSESYASEFRAPIGLSLGIGMAGFCSWSYASGYSDGSLLELVRVCCMIPDGVAFHLPLTNHLDLSPYVNFSGLVMEWNNQGSGHIYYSPKGGIRLLYPLGSGCVLSAEQTIKRTYNGGLSMSLGGGISLVF